MNAIRRSAEARTGSTKPITGYERTPEPAAYATYALPRALSSSRILAFLASLAPDTFGSTLYSPNLIEQVHGSRPMPGSLAEYDSRTRAVE